MIYKFNKSNNKEFLQDKKIAIVLAYFYEDIANNLLSASKKTLLTYGANLKNIDIFYAPGAYEVPLIAKNLTNNYDGIITLGAIIQGETPHFDFIATECSAGIAKISLASNTPIAFGILTTNNMSETIGRSGGYKGNKGEEATMAMIETMYLLGQI